MSRHSGGWTPYFSTHGRGRNSSNNVGRCEGSSHKVKRSAEINDAGRPNQVLIPKILNDSYSSFT